MSKITLKVVCALQAVIITMFIAYLAFDNSSQKSRVKHEITFNDFVRAYAYAFERVDVDKKGYLTRQDILNAKNSASHPSLKRLISGMMNVKAMDRNNDGNLDRAELFNTSFLKNHFNKLDKDSNAKLSRTETQNLLMHNMFWDDL